MNIKNDVISASLHENQVGWKLRHAVLAFVEEMVKMRIACDCPWGDGTVESVVSNT